MAITKRLCLVDKVQPASVVAGHLYIGALVARLHDETDLFDTGAQHLFEQDAQLFDVPQRIELEVRRSSGVRVADGEARVWVNGVLVRHITGICTNKDTNQNWQLQIGQQISYTPKKAELYNEMRGLDEVTVANRKP